MTLPADNHVHSEWSWDASKGSMERTCAQAVALGLPAIAFTEHLDHTVRTLVPPAGLLTPAAFDVSGYLESIERCRERFPVLRIYSGLEIGEPHWHATSVAAVLGAGRFDRVLGSLHCLPDGKGFADPADLYWHRAAAEVVREYLAEVARLVTESDAFSVLAHIDYPIRAWPRREAGPFDITVFEEEFRHALRATAQSGRALEINTKIPLHSTVVRWWHEVGGEAVTFGSDAHEPSIVARGFREAADMAEANGFRPGPSPYDLWARVR